MHHSMLPSCAKPLRPGAHRCPWFLVLGLILSLSASSAAGERDDVATGFRAELAAGNFDRATQLAIDAAGIDRRQRDAWLTQVVAARAAAGDRAGAISSASYIASDVDRAAALKKLPAAPVPARGGGANADFDTLIDLITTTVAPTGWDEVGGPGSIREYPGGVFVDPQGVLQRLSLPSEAPALADLRGAAAQRGDNANVLQSSRLRKVSLNRLEKYVQLRHAEGRPLDAEMVLLAGLYKLEYVLIYPESNDLVIAGPAGPWGFDVEGRALNLDTGRPVLRLDDLVTLLRQQAPRGGEPFGCSITPTQDALARTHAYLAETGAKPLPLGGRKEWLQSIRDRVGRQVVEVFGIDPHSRAARVLVEADYRMKLVGIGLEEGTPDVPSYLELVAAQRGAAPPLDVLRWWFTMNYGPLAASPERNAYHLRGQSVRVQSENELLTERGQRVHTGQSDRLNAQFARNFTEHFAALATRYPIYAELENLFDLALLAALIHREGLAAEVDWHMTCFGNEADFPLPRGRAPESVETVINDVPLGGRRFVAAVSGGVSAEPAAYLVPEAIEVDRSGQLQSQRVGAMRIGDLPDDAWWWD